MGIERTDKWLDENFDQPIKLIKEQVLSSRVEDERKLYNYLRSFGMYSPNLKSKEIVESLKKHNYWTKASQIFNRYKKGWKGPDIPIYIFPIHEGIDEAVSGVSFKNKMFLFLSPLKDIKELESLIVHEYHHVCRLNQGTKVVHEYTVLDSIIMEGFAEFAVTKNCGEKYNAHWIRRFSDDQLEKFYHRFLKEHLRAKRTDKIHDRLIFGKGFYPKLLGYSVGYWLVKKASQKQDFSINETFSIQSEEILKILGLNT
ncbi:DUF2268 domain-containing protein [Niallia sp. Krafla_26]|uniref:DUF2268 domain-containing protein n=1 Tax=Niallia sp. Krafla_26 TaxID=3064703 RepID=UPI003D16B2CF